MDGPSGAETPDSSGGGPSPPFSSGPSQPIRPVMESPSDRPRPIYSSFADDPAQQDLIDAFVVGLAERVDELQDCEARGEFERLLVRAESLLGDARKAGYDPLVHCASTVRLAAQDAHSREARKSLIELTEVSQRVRLGHRGAA